MITYTFDLDIVPGGVPVKVPLKQYEDAYTLIFNVYASTGTLALSDGTTVAIRGTKPDCNGISINAELSGTQVTVAVDKQMTAVAGTSPYELVFSDASGKELITATFFVYVQRAALDEDTLPSESVIKELATAINQADQIIAAAAEVKQARQYVEGIEEQLMTATAQALEKATNAENEAAEAANAIAGLKETDQTMQLQLENKFDGAFVEQGSLYMTSNGEVMEGPLGPFAGSGGGSGGGTDGGNNAKLSVTNASGFLSTTIANGDECPLSLNWSSIEDDIPTGNGVLKITVNGSVKAMLDVEQGLITPDVAPYLGVGSNAVRMNIADVYGNNRTINFSITTVILSISSPFDAGIAYQGPISFPFVPTGAVAKTIHFLLDNAEIHTMQTSVSGRQQSYTIPNQSHGSHTFEVYFDCTINNQLVESNRLYYELICLEIGSEQPIIVSSFKTEEVAQYTTVYIPYSVYDPLSLTREVILSVNNIQVSKQTVDRTQQSWAYRVDDVGEYTFKIDAGNGVTKTLQLNVVESDIQVEAETEALALYLTSSGRSNNEEDPSIWNFGNIEAQLTGFNWVSDGWLSDADGITVLRVAGNARVNIPYQAFKTDCRGTGKTIEFEFATRDIMDYDAVIISCMSGGRGFEITAQRATMVSEQSNVSTQYKEDEHIRVSFVVEKQTKNRLLLCYINGIMSGAVQYPTDDDFAQATHANISIGSNDCAVELYNIRIYDNDLTREQILDNWVADTQKVEDMLARFTRNQIYDAYGNVVIGNLPGDLPYLVLECEALPQSKGDKKTCSGYYVDPVKPEKSFTFKDAEIDVQGTSSQYYYVKNYKIKFKGGFILTNGSTIEVYQLNANVVPTSTYTFKADVASSEGANNVVLAQLYNELCPTKTPPQLVDSRVRQTIDGHPIVIFWNNGTEITFLGKYNFNHDKGTAEVFGFAAGDESWEILQNGTDRVGFHSADFSDDGWKDDFEARYPKDNTNTTNLAAFSAWLVSTDTTQATGNALGEAVTYDGVEYTNDTEEYRLAKFKWELEDWMDVAAAVFYYVFTEVFLCIDQREKNAFPTLFTLLKLWMILFYDADSSLGTDNKGNLAFEFWLEDIDYTEAGDPIFNGQGSTLWVNLRRCFYDKIVAEYQRLRTTLRGDGSGEPLLSYNVVNGKFEAHQNKWPEAIYNEDGNRKSIVPLEVLGEGMYLPMLQGKKEQHRKWWLYNRFRYLDSKYVTGTSMEKRITIRAHQKANVTLISYVNMYGHVYFNAAMVEHRMFKNQEYEFVWPASGAEDPVIGINDADMLTSLGDLAPLMVELINVSNATHLTYLKVGDAAEDYENLNLVSLTFGNNKLLRLVDLRNCKKFGTGEQQALDMSGCTNVEEVYLDGTTIRGVTLPDGGILKKLHLPETVANLTLRNQKELEEFVLPSYSQITTLRLENNSDVIDDKAIFDALVVTDEQKPRVRIIGFDWSFDSIDDVFAFYDRLDTMRGLDEAGNNVDDAQMGGTIRVDSLTGNQYAELKSRYPYIDVVYNHINSFLYFYNDDGSQLLYTATVQDGGNGMYVGSEPTKASTAQYNYSFIGWSKKPNSTTVDNDAIASVVGDRNVYAVFSATVRKYTVYWKNGSTTLETDSNVPYGTTPTYNGSTPVYTGTDPDDWEFNGWSPAVGPIVGTTTYTAQFKYTGYVSVSLVERSISGEFVNKSITEIGEYAFQGCTNMTSANIPAVTSIGVRAFDGCSKLETVTVNSVVSVGERAFNDCNKLVEVDFPATLTTIGSEAFFNCKALETVVFRSTTKVACGTTPFGQCGIVNGTGYMYVPTAVLDEYKTASFWKTYAVQYRAIEDYPETVGRFTWEAVANNIASGKYKEAYKLGDTVLLDLGSEGVINMQVVGIDVDDLTAGGKAHISWISVELLSSSVDIITGTDCTVGWAGSKVRTYLKETIKPLMPEILRNMIVTVNKEQTCHDSSNIGRTQYTEDDVWIPDSSEMSKSGKYGEFYDTAAFGFECRAKCVVGSTTYTTWCTRSTSSKRSWQTITSGGTLGATSPSGNKICLGFCT